jgi:hypothetical protein
MRIAVIGKGNIGGALGSKWRAAGHEVIYGARDGSGEGPGGAPVRSIGEAVKDADVVLLAVPGQAVPDVVAEQGAAIASKVVIDAVNRIGAPELGCPAPAQQQPPRAGGQHEHVLSGVAACGQGRVGGDHSHRTTGLLAHPGNATGADRHHAETSSAARCAAPSSGALSPERPSSRGCGMRGTWVSCQAGSADRTCHGSWLATIPSLASVGRQRSVSQR